MNPTAATFFALALVTCLGLLCICGFLSALAHGAPRDEDGCKCPGGGEGWFDREAEPPCYRCRRCGKSIE